MCFYIDSSRPNPNNTRVMIRFHNTLSGRKEVFEPLVPGQVGLYTCGPTVYDYPHIGNYRAYLFEDLLKRFLIFMGFKVLHVMNITDVDDKTIRGAAEQGVGLAEFTEKYTRAFFEDIDTLNVFRADHYPRATENIPDMARMVKGLLEKGYAYEKEGSYYFDISKFKDYGKLSKVNLEERRAGVRIDSDEYEKESVHDFALWKAPKEGEPFWETVIGPGRPGWHIECSVMSAKYLGETFDIHCGGVDNIFPHHENEIAQSEAFTGKPFVRYWLHCQHLIRDGEKMSKSKGNTVTLKELLEDHGADPMAVRFLLLSTHYRKILNFTFDALDQAASSLARMNGLLDLLAAEEFEEGENPGIRDLIRETEKRFTEGLSDDLNVSASVSAAFELIRKAHAFISRKECFRSDAENLIRALASVDKVLGVLRYPPNIRVEGIARPGRELRVTFGKRTLPQEVEAKIREREKARREKNYSLADKIRDELRARGILLEDTPEGVRWKVIKK